MAARFAELGADVAVSGRRAERLEEVADQVRAKGRRAVAVPCDVTDEEQVAAAVQTVIDTFGRLDVAVANAGFGVSGRITELDAATWRRQLDVNVVGAALTARYAVPHLAERRGRLALVGSVSGLVYLPGNGAYQASKAAVLAMGRTLAMELAPQGVSCTVLQPGFVHSEIGQVDNQGRHDPERRDKRPAQLMWATDDAARVMVRAIERRKVEYTFTGHGRVAAFLGRHLPGVVQLLGPKVV
jgi:NAD(P)-dependent dehydrogenase (short-subunit alcohol dehydrogenase family)